MLRLNIRCLNNQVRFEPRRLRREATKGRRLVNERTRENVRLNAGASERDDKTRVVHELKRKREREEEAEEEIPVPTEWESNTFSAVPRFRSAPDPPPLPSLHLSYTFSSAPPPPLTLRRTSRRSLRRVFPLAVFTLSVYTYYAKRVTVGGLGSQTRSV